MGIFAGTFALDNFNDGSSFCTSNFCIITSVGCPLIHPSRLTVAVNDSAFIECKARAPPVNSVVPEVVAGPINVKPYTVFPSTVQVG